MKVYPAANLVSAATAQVTVQSVTFIPPSVSTTLSYAARQGKLIALVSPLPRTNATQRFAAAAAAATVLLFNIKLCTAAGVDRVTT